MRETLEFRPMSDFYENDDLKYVSGATVQPQKYNIILTRDGDEIEFDFAPATAENILRYGFVTPLDKRCTSGLIDEEEELYTALSPVLGSTFNGSLSYHTRKQVIISLHDAAILGYQRQSIIDPRISNEVATFWEIYIDKRIFPQAEDSAWRNLMAEIIICEKDDDEADQKLAEDIKDRLLSQAQ